MKTRPKRQDSPAPSPQGRWALLWLLGSAAAVLLFSEPTAGKPAAWWTALAATKTLGAALASLAWRLYRRWRREGKLPALPAEEEEGGAL